MTKQRFDDKSTEFGIWLRQQKEIDSNLGFVATNLDYVWTNYKTGKWMLIEEKRYSSQVKFYQENIFKVLDKACRNDINYCGFHKIIFQNTNPDDGLIWLDGIDITKEQLVDFLCYCGKKGKIKKRANSG